MPCFISYLLWPAGRTRRLGKSLPTDSIANTIEALPPSKQDTIWVDKTYTGMTMGDFFRKYPSATPGVDEISDDTEYAYVPVKSYL